MAAAERRRACRQFHYAQSRPAIGRCCSTGFAIPQSSAGGEVRLRRKPEYGSSWKPRLRSAALSRCAARPVGYAHAIDAACWGEELPDVLPQWTWDVDIFIGEPEYRGRTSARPPSTCWPTKSSRPRSPWP